MQTVKLAKVALRPGAGNMVNGLLRSVLAYQVCMDARFLMEGAGIRVFPMLVRELSFPPIDDSRVDCSHAGDG
jgi:hypothetical protein